MDLLEECQDAMTKGINRLKEIYPEMPLKKHLFDHVRSFDTNRENDYPYWYADRSYAAKVDTMKVVGTTHTNYQNQTWLEMLGSLGRNSRSIDRVLSHISNPHAGEIHFAKVDGEYFICGDGNHRTCYAKILGLPHIEASVTEYKRDNLRIEREQSCRDRNITFEYSKSSGIWYLTLNLRSFQINDELIPDFFVFYDEIKNDFHYHLKRKMGLIRMNYPSGSAGIQSAEGFSKIEQSIREQKFFSNQNK